VGSPAFLKPYIRAGRWKAWSNQVHFTRMVFHHYKNQTADNCGMTWQARRSS